MDYSFAWYLYPVIIIVGFIAGFINTLAGNGSLLTLPLLIFLGLPVGVANGTNRVAVVLQAMVATGSFRQQKLMSIRRSLLLAIPAIIGAIVGAQIAVSLNEEILRKVIGALMVLMLFSLLLRPKRWLIGMPERIDKKPSLFQYLIFFLIGIHGGFIQAGVGIFLLAGLVLSAGYDLVRANAVKNLIVVCFTAFALLIFFLNDQVNWGIGLILAVGNMAGAWVASRMAVKQGASFVRWLLIAVVIIAALFLLGVVDF